MAFALACIVAALWHFTALSSLAHPDRLAVRLDDFAGSRWSPVVVIGCFIIGGCVMFPVTILSAATAMVFHPLIAAPLSFAGELLSAALMYWAGARLMHGFVRNALGAALRKIDQTLTRQGVLAIAALRTVPVAPFTVVNMAAGSIGVRFRDFILGTALGLAPGVLLTSLFGRQVRTFWQSPSWTGFALMGGVLIVWIAVSVFLQRWLTRRAGQAGARNST